MKNIKIDKFCGLITNNTFIRWLRLNYKDIYNDIIEHLLKSPSCSANKQKMLEIVDVFDKNNDKALYNFIISEFPEMVEDTKIFNHYDPDLMTLPKKLVIKGKNAESEFNDFILNVAKYDYINVGGTYFIEYIPTQFEHLSDKISDNNWEIKKWKNKN